MISVKKFLNEFEENILAVLMPVMVIVVFFATVCRYTKLLVLTWPEELARYLMVWLTYLGAGAVAKRNGHFSVEALVRVLPEKARRYLNIFRVVIVTFYCILIVVFSYHVMISQIQMEQKSPAMFIPMWMVYLAIPIGCFLFAFRLIQNTFWLSGDRASIKEK